MSWFLSFVSMVEHALQWQQFKKNLYLHKADIFVILGPIMYLNFFLFINYQWVKNISRISLKSDNSILEADDSSSLFMWVSVYMIKIITTILKITNEILLSIKLEVLISRWRSWILGSLCMQPTRDWCGLGSRCNCQICPFVLFSGQHNYFVQK